MGWPWGRDPRSGSYRIFTTAFDEVVTGRDLTKGLSAIERSAWHATIGIYDETVAGHRANASASALQMVEELRASPAVTLDEWAASVLVDHSGSMKGRRAMIACFAMETAAEIFTGMGIPFEILGFTTRSWKGGASRRRWDITGRPRNPGRLADVLHIVYRDFACTVPGAPGSVRHVLRHDLLKENIDGEALFRTSERLKARPEPRKLILVVSDGAPVDDSTPHENVPDILINHLKDVAASFRATPGYALCGLGIDLNPSSIYSRSTAVHGPGEVSEHLAGLIGSTITG